MPALIDTNVLVDRFDPRCPAEQAAAPARLRDGIRERSVVVPHQAIPEFVQVVTRVVGGGPALLEARDAGREAEMLRTQVDVRSPDAELVRIALRGAAASQLAWFDAHLWACAERSGLDPLWSEDFESGRRYGTVAVANPFAAT
ncbi:MAG: PIN domain-containing protein [Solirubrobacteraceae bacterium]